MVKAEIDADFLARDEYVEEEIKRALMVKDSLCYEFLHLSSDY